MTRFWLGALALTLLATPRPVVAQVPSPPQGAAARIARTQLLPLPEWLAPRESMISSLAWLGDDLILVPQQRPRGGRRSSHRGRLYSIPRAAVEREIDTPTGERLPVEVWSLVTSELDTLDSFGGFEALAFAGDAAFMTVESNNLRAPPGVASPRPRGR